MGSLTVDNGPSHVKMQDLTLKTAMKTSKLVLIFAFITLLLLPAYGSEGGQTSLLKGELQIIIEGLSSRQGNVYIALHNNRKSYEEKSSPFLWKRAAIENGKSLWIISGLPYGEYGVSVYHDENGDSSLNTNIAGIPSEPYGFSNNVPASFGSPAYEKIMFSHKSRKTTITVKVNGGGKGSWAFGAAVFSEESPYKGMGSQTLGFPVLSYHGSHLYLEGLRGGVTLGGWKEVRFGFFGEYRYIYFDEGKTNTLRGMEKRRSTLEAGAEMKVPLIGEVVFKGEVLFDILGIHKGEEIRGTLERRFTHKNLSLTPSIGVEVQSSSLANYYYGVREEEKSSFRPGYETGRAVNFKGMLQMVYRFGESYLLVSRAAWKSLDSEIQKSPIVEKDALVSLFLGLFYQFLRNL